MTDQPEITLETKVQQSISPIQSPMDESLMMFSQEQAHYYTLEAVAKDIWERLEQPMVVEALCQDLMKEYEVEKEKCYADVLTFLRDLRNDNLIQIVS